MKKTDRSDSLLIEDITTEVNFILQILPKITKDDLIEDKLYQNALIRSIEVIGEAAKDLSDEFEKNNPDFPIHKMSKSRDKMIHGYVSINYDIVWEIISKDIPEVQIELQKIKL